MGVGNSSANVMVGDNKSVGVKIKKKKNQSLVLQILSGIPFMPSKENWTVHGSKFCRAQSILKWCLILLALLSLQAAKAVKK